MEIREYVDDDRYNYVAEYDAEVLNGEINLPIITLPWYNLRKTGCYYVMVKLKGKKEYILDSGYRNFHANYLYMENRMIFHKPQINSPKNKTATTVTVPNEPSKKKNPANSVFYYKGTKKWGKLDNKGFPGEYSRITEQQIKENTNAIGWANINQLRGKTLEQVKESYEGLALGVRRVVSDYVADKVIYNFYQGRGRKLSFKDWPQFQSDLEEYPYFRQYFYNYLDVIKYMLKEKSIQTKDGDEIVDIFRDKLNTRSEYSPDFSIKSDMFRYDFYGLMGGTQTVKVDLEIEEWMPGTYKIKTEMYIGDWYGADWDDVNGTLKGNIHSLQAFFWLQHYFGCQPFETEIYYKSTDYIDL